MNSINNVPIVLTILTTLFKGELPVFTPPVVINRPPQSLIDLQVSRVEYLIGS